MYCTDSKIRHVGEIRKNHLTEHNTATTINNNHHHQTTTTATKQQLINQSSHLNREHSYNSSPAVGEHAVQLVRVGAQRHAALGLLRDVHRQTQVLLHEA